MTPEQINLLHDAALSDSARVLGLYLSDLPEGEHELSHDDLAALLHGTPNADTVGRHLRQLVVRGYIERTSRGGSGSPRYRWSARENSRASESLPAKIHGQEAPMLVEDGGASPPVIPLRPISPDAEAAIEQHGERFKGFRDAMREYLRKRVPLGDQRATVQTVATWLDGFGFSWRGYGGAAIPPEHHTGLLAATFNELAATDEKLYKHPPGDIRNVKTKLGILCGDWGKPARAATGTDGGRGKAEKGPQDAQEYKPKPWRGWNG